MSDRRKHWGWGMESADLPADQAQALAEGFAAHVGFGRTDLEAPKPLEQIELPEVKLQPPASLASICSTEAHDRIFRSHGAAYRDVVRAMRGQLDAVPDIVARPTNESEIQQIFEWCSDAGVAVIPFGGGTSVVGGVEPRVGSGFDGTLSMDMAAFGKVLEVDPISRSARIEGGATGPSLEAQLAKHDLTLR